MVTNNKFNINEIKLTVPEYSKNKDNPSSAKTIDEINELELIKAVSYTHLTLPTSDLV